MLSKEDKEIIFNFPTQCANYILFIFIWTIFLVTIIYSLTTEGLGNEFELIFLLFSIIFFWFGIKQKSGCDDLIIIYEKIGIKEGNLNYFLSYLPVVSFMIYMIITLYTLGIIILGFLLALSVISFFVPFIIYLFFEIIKEIDKLMSKKK